LNEGAGSEYDLRTTAELVDLINRHDLTVQSAVRIAAPARKAAGSERNRNSSPTWGRSDGSFTTPRHGRRRSLGSSVINTTGPETSARPS
jgi:hypothetical protein